MPAPSNNHLLNQLLVVLGRSLPMYLSQAAPWVSYNGDSTSRALGSLVADQTRYAERLTQLLQSRRHTIDPGEFPMSFTDLHDLSLSFLMTRLVEHQQRDIEAIQRHTEQLRSDPEGLDLAEAILANARSHLVTLEPFAALPAPAI